VNLTGQPPERLTFCLRKNRVDPSTLLVYNRLLLSVDSKKTEYLTFLIIEIIHSKCLFGGGIESALFAAK